MQSAGASAICRGIAMVLFLLQVRIGIEYLGTDLFGFWVALGSMGIILGVADLGLGFGLQNRVSHAMGEGQPGRIPALAARAGKSLAVVSVVVLLGGLTAVQFRIPGRLFHMPGVGTDIGLNTCFLIAVAGVAVAIPLGIPNRVATGLQMGWLSSIGQVVSAAAVLSVLIVSWKLRFPFPLFLVLAVAAGQCGSVLVAVVLLGRFRWSIPDFKARPVAADGMTRHGLRFLLPQAGAVVVNQYPVIAISSVLGVSAVVPWVVAMRTLGMITQVHGFMVGPLWPAFSEASASREFEWISRTFRKTAAFSIIFGTAMGVAMALLGRRVIVIATGVTGSVPDVEVYLGLVAWSVASVLIATPVTLLNALDRLGVQSACAAVTIVTVVSGVPWAAANFGLAGAAVLLGAVYGILLLPVLWGEALATINRISGEQLRDPA